MASSSCSEMEIKWINELETKNPLELLAILKEIYLESLKSKDRQFSTSFRGKLLKIIQEHKNLSKMCLEISCKALFQTQSNSTEDYPLDDLLKLSLVDARLGVFVVNGILTTNYRKSMENKKLAELVLQVVNFCSHQHSIFILWALRNLVSFCKQYTDFEHDHEALLRVVWMNMTCTVTGVREQNLSLLEFVTKEHPERSKTIFREVLTRWSWMNPYKYYILGVILGNMKFKQVTGEDFDKELFLEGLAISLKHRNLLSPGQYLFKSLMKHPGIDISDIVRNIMLKRSLLESDNFINQWLSCCPNLDELYEEVVLDEDFDDEVDKVEYIPMRRAFREQMEQVETDAEIEDFSGFINEFVDQPILLQHFYEILIYRITKRPDIDTEITNFTDFLEIVAQSKDTGLRQYIFKRFPMILDHLVRKNHDHPEEVSDLFEWIIHYLDESYEHSMDHPDAYQRIIFSLRLYEMLLKFFSQEKKHQVLKNPHKEAISHILEFMSEDGPWLVSENNFDIIYHYLETDESLFDDVQELASEIICDFFAKDEFRERIRSGFKDRLQSCSIEKSICCHLYARILSRWNENPFEAVEESLKKATENFRKDPFASVQDKCHLFNKIDSLTECLENNPPLPHRISPMIKFCAELAEDVLKFLNHTGEFEEAPSFEVMEESLQVIIDKSAVKPREESLPEARKQLLLSLWMTLKACGDFCAASVKILKQDTEKHEIETCLRVNTMILQRCRHKGAIEAAGLSLGRVVREICNSDVDIVMQELENLLAGKRNLSTTRRGAGYSIMLLNLVRNDTTEGRKLLQRAMEILLTSLRDKQPGVENYDNVEAIMLHYLCVLVKDSSLAEDMLVFVQEILTIAFHKIDSEEWTVRNGALQLCGALIPKIVGQKMHFQEDDDWQPVKLSVDDLRIRLGDINTFLLDTLTNSAQNSTTLIITILELLSRIEFWWTEIYAADNILAFRAVLWNLLEHPCHKIRFLAAKCFANFHEFHQIPYIVFQIIPMLPQITNPNLFHGLLVATDALTKKYRSDSFAIPTHMPSNFLPDLHTALRKDWSTFPRRNFCPFIRMNLKKFLQNVESDLAGEIESPEI